MPHINEGIILKKLQEIRDKTNDRAIKDLTNQIENLLKDKPKGLYVVRELPKGQTLANTAE